MAATTSQMLALGTRAPDFLLPNVVDGQLVGPACASAAKGLLVMFICNHCPYVVHVLPELERVVGEALDAGVAVIAINANSIATHPNDGPPHMKRLAEERAWRFPFVFDSDQAVAKAYLAACTPDLFLFDADRSLFYRGRLDDSSPRNGKALTGSDLRAALAAMLAHDAPPADQRPSIGCNIKWAPGNSPEYFGA